MNVIYLVSGANLHRLGQRNPVHYGTLTYASLVQTLTLYAKEKGYELEAFQSNHEGALIDFLCSAYDRGGVGIVFNPGAFTHYAYSLHDTVEMKTIPIVEVHLSDISRREPWRAHSVLAPVVDAQFIGEGIISYQKAIDYLISLLKKPSR